MRSEKELWQVVLSRPDLFRTGLCAWVVEAKLKGVMDEFEYYKLREAIQYYRQLMKKRTVSKAEEALFWIGRPGDLQARIDWINDKINGL